MTPLRTSVTMLAAMLGHTVSATFERAPAPIDVLLKLNLDSIHVKLLRSVVARGAARPTRHHVIDYSALKQTAA